jgi:hypothetical protein
MKHPTETELNEYLDGALKSSAQARIEAHLSDCAHCRARQASLQAIFQTLAALPEETPGRDLTPSVLRALPRSFSGLAWLLAFAVQAGLSLGLLLLFAPVVTSRLTWIVHGLAGQIDAPEVKLPIPLVLHFSLPVLRLPHPPVLGLPIAITCANSAAWIIMGIAAVLLFAVGNFSLIFHSSSEIRNNKRRMP